MVGKGYDQGLHASFAGDQAELAQEVAVAYVEAVEHAYHGYAGEGSLARLPPRARDGEGVWEAARLRLAPLYIMG